MTVMLQIVMRHNEEKDIIQSCCHKCLHFNYKNQFKKPRNVVFQSFSDLT